MIADASTVAPVGKLSLLLVVVIALDERPSVQGRIGDSMVGDVVMVLALK